MRRPGDVFLVVMIPCHVAPFVRPEPRALEPREATVVVAVGEHCDYCGSSSLEWRKCKLVCASCRQINKSCADL